MSHPGSRAARCRAYPPERAPCVECLGAELTVTFLPRFGGAGLHISRNAGADTAAAALVGNVTMARMADHPRIGAHIPRVPLARRSPALIPHWQGHSTAEIARRLRIPDVTARACIASDRVA